MKYGRHKIFKSLISKVIIILVIGVPDITKAQLNAYGGDRETKGIVEINPVNSSIRLIVNSEKPEEVVLGTWRRGDVSGLSVSITDDGKLALQRYTDKGLVESKGVSLEAGLILEGDLVFGGFDIDGNRSADVVIVSQRKAALRWTLITNPFDGEMHQVHQFNLGRRGDTPLVLNTGRSTRPVFTAIRGLRRTRSTLTVQSITNLSKRTSTRRIRGIFADLLADPFPLAGGAQFEGIGFLSRDGQTLYHLQGRKATEIKIPPPPCPSAKRGFISLDISSNILLAELCPQEDLQIVGLLGPTRNRTEFTHIIGYGLDGLRQNWGRGAVSRQVPIQPTITPSVMPVETLTAIVLPTAGPTDMPSEPPILPIIGPGVTPAAPSTSENPSTTSTPNTSPTATFSPTPTSTNSPLEVKISSPDCGENTRADECSVVL